MYVTNIRERLGELGIELPPGLARIEAIQSALSEIIHVQPTHTLEADLLEGRFTEAEARERVRGVAFEMAVHHYSKEVAQELTGTLEKLDRREIVASGDVIVESMRPVFDKAAGELAVFVEAFGVDVTAEQLIGEKRGSESWQTREKARVMILAVRRVCHYLRLAGYFDATEEAAWFVAELFDEAQFHEATRVAGGHDTDLSGLVAMGLKLRLNTRADADRVMAAMRDTWGAVEAEKAKRQAAEDEAAKAKYRHMWADKLPVRK